MSDSVFASGFRPHPYWWDSAPRPTPEEISLPEAVEVLVVGSGYTGLHAALQTAREGFDTLVLDSDSLGYGCSSRNGGQVSTSVKGGYTELAKQYGSDRAVRLLKEGIAALDFLDEFITEENLDCAWERCGRFSGAHNSAAYDSIARALSALPDEIAVPWHMVPRHEQHDEIGSDFYHGGVVYPDHAALDPGLYHLELLSRVRAAGATTVGNCPVNRIERTASGFNVHTPAGRIRAAKVAIATNGYTQRVTPWHRRRIIPIGSYIIATEPLPESVASEISPHTRVMSDSRKLVFYYRLSPDRTRMLFGGRVALKETDPRVSAPALHKAMCKIFPQLQTTRVTHSWLGFVGYTFDTLPHVGEDNGMFYAMGYCGSGVSLASYCGSKIGRQMAGHPDGETVFTESSFQTRPFYRGDPWFLQPSILYYKARDRLNL